MKGWPFMRASQPIRDQLVVMPRFGHDAAERDGVLVLRLPQATGDFGAVRPLVGFAALHLGFEFVEGAGSPAADGALVAVCGAVDGELLFSEPTGLMVRM